MEGQLVFVSSENSTGRLGVSERQLIRSRCMQGVNKKQNSRRSLRASRQADRSNKQLQETRVSQRNETDDRSTMPRCSPAAGRNYSPRGNGLLDLEVLQLIHQDTELYPREFMFNFTAFKEVKGIISPLFNSLSFNDMKDHSGLWLAHDVPFRHAVVLMVAAYRECSADGRLSTLGWTQHTATVNQLNKRLSNTPEYLLIDTTIFIMNILATVAAWLGRYNEFAVHMRAIRHVIRLRGGKDFLRRRPFIKYHLQCLSLADSLSTGCESHLDDIHQDAMMGPNFSHTAEKPSNLLPESFNRLVDHRLAAIYVDLQEVVAQINKQGKSNELLDFTVYQLPYTSILQRLLDLRETLLDSLSECFRLGLLAFLATVIFRTPKAPARTQSQHAYLALRYRRHCQSLDISTPHLSSLLFWLLTVGAMSIFDVEEEAWLVQKWNAVTMAMPGARLAWEDAKPHLETVLWIGGVHDDMGQKAYRRLMRSDS